MNYIRIFVTLKITDNIARSALHAVRDRMGYRQINALRRTEFWELAIPKMDEIQAQEFAEKIVTQTSLFMNPNKHRHRIEIHSESVNQAASLAPEEGWNASILVCDRIDGSADSALHAIQKMLPADAQPDALIRGAWWDMDVENASPDEARALVEELAEAKSRTQGLFSNPHYQTCQVFTA